jgi:hypothetical protein
VGPLIDGAKHNIRTTKCHQVASVGGLHR